MSKGLDNNTSIKDFVTIIDKQIVKLKDTDPPQEPKEISSKSTTPKDATESNKVKTPKTIPKQTHNKTVKSKETIQNIKVKTPRQHNNNNTEHDDKHKGVSTKRNASVQSPLESNPRKKQKDINKSEDTDTSPNAIDTNYLESNNTYDVSDSYQVHATPMQLDNDQQPKTNIEQLEHNMPLHT